MNLRPRAAQAALALDQVTHSRLHAFNLDRAEIPAASLFGVYRRKNDGYVAALLDHAPEGISVALHALDEVSPHLRQYTVSVGPGKRMELIDKLMERQPPPSEDYVLIADDDVTFPAAGLATLIRLAHLAQLDLAMPAHATHSHHTFRVTRQRAASTVRRTGFVEIGPVLVVSPRALQRIYPFPPNAGMGWGLDVRWSALAREGFRLGLVDATPIVHIGQVGTAYSRGEEEQRLAEACNAMGVSSAYELAFEIGAPWRPWRRRPPWAEWRTDS